MSQLEHSFYSFLNKHPEVRSTCVQNLLNIRALARAFMDEEKVEDQSIEAVVAMIRRSDIKYINSHIKPHFFSDIQITVREGIIILDYAKLRSISRKIDGILSKVDYSKHETVKLVVGSHSVKLIVDKSNRDYVLRRIGEGDLIKEYSDVAEVNVLLPKETITTPGVAAYVTSQIALNGINTLEIVTCTPGINVYVNESDSVKVYNVLRRIKQRD